ncbi:MAG: acyclic terpene utilization AtuA family protein [Burkholderiaceae bacterium]|nr:DUF1446 domain-containing protein [Rhodoferax sp.]MCP5261512.1 DUF1446 domain-containing protein [Rhodoferax sp.]
MKVRPDDASRKTVRIGGAGAFVGDSVLGPQQLVAVEGMQYLVFDYLAEMTLSSFAQTRKRDPNAGYAAEFVDVAMQEVLGDCVRRGIRVVSNAGGLNPRACAQAVERLASAKGLAVKVAWIDGDDCVGLVEPLRREGVRDFYTGAAMPDVLESANVYLGAFPIARALDLGADIVVTGRIVDSATTLGILIHAFGWGPGDLDRLAAGSLAGHLLECGAQVTGGIFTDWRDVPDWENIGYPYVDCSDDGGIVVCKPEGTGGLVSEASVSEQVLYEVGDPAHYVLPDVVCDFSGVTVQQLGPHRVAVRGARGAAPPPTHKLTASFLSGYRCITQLSVFGIDAIEKARRTGEALVARTRAMLLAKGMGDFDKLAVTVIGAEDGYGPHARPSAVREAIVRVAALHRNAQALELLSRESRSPGVSFAPGTTSGSSLTLNSRPAVEPLHGLFTCLVPKSLCAVPRVVMGMAVEEVPLPAAAAPQPTPAGSPSPVADRPDARPFDASGPQVQLPLILLAHGRSGDKGDTSTLSVIARDASYLPLLAHVLTPAAVKDYLAHLVKGSVQRYAVPGLHALNFHLDQSLDGGAPSSLRTDPMGKGLAQMLLGMPVPVPQAWLSTRPELQARRDDAVPTSPRAAAWTSSP